MTVSTVSLHGIKAYLGTTELPVQTARITLDESWAPYAQASLTVAIPDAETLELLDPRNDVRIQLIATLDYGTSQPLSVLTDQYGGTDTIAGLTTAWGGLFLYEVTAIYYKAFNVFGVRDGSRRVFDLTLRSRSINYGDSLLSLDLSSDEALLQDYSLVATNSAAAASLSVRSTVNTILSFIGRELEPGTSDGTFDADAGIWEPGQTAWDYLQPLVQSNSLRLYCDELRKWNLVEDQAETTGAISLSYIGTITRGDETISRDTEDWYDAVVCKYEYIDGSGNTIIEYDVASTPGFSKVLTLTFDTAKPGAGQAARILQRAEGRGRVNDIRAISDYSATPGITASLSLPDTDTQVGTLSAVTWNFPDDEMDITTRGLIEVSPYAWLYQAVGKGWNDITAGITWNTYTP